MLLSALTGGMVTTQALAQEASNDAPVFRFKMSVENEAMVPEWIVINHNYTPWQNDGPFGACTTWEPKPVTIDWGQDFQQSRVCQQPQVRMATPVLLNPISKRTKLGDAFQESQTTPVADYQNNIGKRDFITGERADSWPEWQNLRAPYDCSVWTPDRNEVRLYDPFTQTRDCSQDQSRSRNVYNVWASGQETAKRVDNDTQTITVSQTQPAVGQKDEIDGTRADTPTAWINDGGHYSCTAWTPLPVGQKSDYTQTRDCQQDQTRTQDHYDVWVSGKETLNRTENHDQTITETESRRVDVSYTNWVNQGDVENCEAWSPAPGGRTADYEQTRVCDQGQVRNRVYTADDQTLNTVEEAQTIKVTQRRDNTMDGLRYDEWSAWTDTAATVCGAWGDAPTTQTSDFTQSRECGTAQKRVRDTFYTWAHSADTFRSVETETRTDPSTETRAVSVSWTNWVNDGAVLNCTAWGDAPTTQTASYTQSRECDQAQVRDRVYKTGGATLNTVQEDQTIRVTQTRTNKMEGIVYGDWSAFANNAALDCGAYSPTPSNQTANFTQSRDCAQSQDRTRATYYSWTYGDNTFRSTETGDRSVPSTQSRTVTVNAGDWKATGNHSFSAYSPAPGSRTASYTQTRSYKQDQARTWTYTAGGSELHSRVQTQTVDKTQSRTNTMNGLEYGAWGAYTNTGATSCGDFSPVPSTQTDTFTQSKGCTTPQKRERDIFYTWAYSSNTFKETGVETRDAGSTQTRSVSVSWTGWANNGDVNSCSGWSPSPGSRTTSYTQTRTCTQPQLRHRDYYVGSTRIARKNETRNITVTQSRTNKMEGIAYGSWSSYSNDGGLSCGGYSPSIGGQTADFTQSRDCDQKQKRTRATYYTWTYGANTYRNTETDTRNVDSDQSRLIDVSASGWSTTRNHSFGSWSPSYGSQSASYTQSQGFKRDQKRTWYYKAGSNTLTTRDETRTISDSRSRTVSVSWSGWSYTSGHHSCGGWTPSTSNYFTDETFTQTRACKRNQAGTYVHKVGTTTVHNYEKTRTVDSTDSRTATGTKPILVTESSTSCDAKQLYDTSYSSWSPSSGNQTADYTQNRERTRKYKQYCYQKQINQKTGAVSKVNGSWSYTTSKNGESRGVDVSVGGWDYDRHSYSSWSPSPGDRTSDFTQKQYYDRDGVRTWTHKDKRNNSTIHTRKETSNHRLSQDRRVDVSAGSWKWTNTGWGHERFEPYKREVTYDYSQSRYYWKTRERTWYYKTGGSTISTRTQVDKPRYTETRTIDVNVYGWANAASKVCYGDWEPYGSSQERQRCKQDQRRAVKTYTPDGTAYHHWQDQRWNYSWRYRTTYTPPPTPDCERYNDNIYEHCK